MSTRQVSSPEDDTVDIGQYLRILRDHKGLLVLGLVLGLLVGGVVAYLQAPSFTSSAQVLVRPVGLSGVDSLNSDANLNIATQQQLASSEEIALLVQQSTGTDESVGSLLGGLDVTQAGRSSVLVFSYTDTTAAGAQERAAAFAEAYLDNRSTLAEDAINAQTEAAQSRIDALQPELEQAQADVAAAEPGSQEAQTAGVQQDVLLNQLSTLQNRLGDLTAVAITPGAVIKPADLPASDGWLTRALLVVSLALFGLVLGIMGAFVRSRIDKRIRRADDVERVLSLPVLAELGGDTKRGPSEAVSLQLLAARLLVATRSTSGGMIALATPVAAPSDAAVAARLAGAMTERGAAVTLVAPRDVDLPADGGVQLVDVATVTGNDRRSGAALDEARMSSSAVILSTPGTLTSAEYLMLASEADAVVLLAQIGTTRSDDLVHAAVGLEEMGSTVIGVILVTGSIRPARPAPTPAPAPAASQEPARSR